MLTLIKLKNRLHSLLTPKQASVIRNKFMKRVSTANIFIVISLFLSSSKQHYCAAFIGPFCIHSLFPSLIFGHQFIIRYIQKASCSAHIPLKANCRRLKNDGSLLIRQLSAIHILDDFIKAAQLLQSFQRSSSPNILLIYIGLHAAVLNKM